jgi:hypothetical protein
VPDAQRPQPAVLAQKNQKRHFNVEAVDYIDLEEGAEAAQDDSEHLPEAETVPLDVDTSQNEPLNHDEVGAGDAGDQTDSEEPKSGGQAAKRFKKRRKQLPSSVFLQAECWYLSRI